MIPIAHQITTGSAYLILFAGTVLEGETLLISAGFAAQQGCLSLPMVVLTAWLGAISGDHFFFVLGRYRGRSRGGARPSMPGRLGKVRALLVRYRSAAIISFRFLYGFRMVAPFAIGAAGVSSVRFVTLDALSGVVWASVYGLAGYFFGAVFDVVVREIQARLAAGAAILGLMALTAVIAVMLRNGVLRSAQECRGTEPAERPARDVEEQMKRKGVDKTPATTDEHIREYEPARCGGDKKVAAQDEAVPA